MKNLAGSTFPEYLNRSRFFKKCNYPCKDRRIRETERDFSVTTFVGSLCLQSRAIRRERVVYVAKQGPRYASLIALRWIIAFAVINPFYDFPGKEKRDRVVCSGCESVIYRDSLIDIIFNVITLLSVKIVVPTWDLEIISPLDRRILMQIFLSSDCTRNYSSFQTKFNWYLEEVDGNWRTYTFFAFPSISIIKVANLPYTL